MRILWLKSDLLLPLEVMGLPFHFSAGEGPVIERPVRNKEDIANLRTDRAPELGYVSEAVALVAKHFADRLLETTARVLARHIRSPEEVSAIMQEIRREAAN